MSEIRRLILVRHGRAETGTPDRERRLTPFGKQEISQLAIQIKEKNWPIDQIVHSGYERAKETAAILSRVLKPETGIEIMDGIQPDDNVHIMKNRLEMEQNILIVSHLPFLGKLLCKFIPAVREDEYVHFTPGTAIALQKGTNWMLAWLVRPES